MYILSNCQYCLSYFTAKKYQQISFTNHLNFSKFFHWLKVFLFFIFLKMGFYLRSKSRQKAIKIRPKKFKIFYSFQMMVSMKGKQQRWNTKSFSLVKIKLTRPRMRNIFASYASIENLWKRIIGVILQSRLILLHEIPWSLYSLSDEIRNSLLSHKISWIQLRDAQGK